LVGVGADGEECRNVLSRVGNEVDICFSHVALADPVGQVEILQLWVFVLTGARHSEVCSTRDIIDAEERLLLAGRATDGPSIAAPSAYAVTAAPLPGKDHPLSAEQAAAVAAVVASGRRLDVLDGGAGTGRGHSSGRSISS
jgi:hypothetical protein